MPPALAIALLWALLVVVGRATTAWLDERHPASVPADRRTRSVPRPHR